MLADVADPTIADHCNSAPQRSAFLPIIDGTKLGDGFWRLFTDGQDTQAIAVVKFEMRVLLSQLMPQTPDAEIVVVDIDVMKQDDASVRELG